MEVTIYDLDNCLSDDSWRIPHIQYKNSNPRMRWHDYHARAAWDQCMYWPPEPVWVILTARPHEYRPMTHEWLKRNFLRPTLLCMRPDGDYRPSVDVKRQQLHDLFEVYGVTAVRAAFDDHAEIVNMYRSEGIPSEIKRIHNVEYPR